MHRRFSNHRLYAPQYNRQPLHRNCMRQHRVQPSTINLLHLRPKPSMGQGLTVNGLKAAKYLPITARSTMW